MPSSTTPTSTPSTQPMPLRSTSTTSTLLTSTTTSTTSSSSSTETTQLHSSKKKKRWTLFLCILFYILFFTLLTISIVQAWSRFRTLFLEQDLSSTSFSSVTSGAALGDYSNATMAATGPASVVPYGGVNPALKDDGGSGGKAIDMDGTRESPEGIVSHPLVVRAADTPPSPPPPPPSHDSQTKRPAAPVAPQSHIPSGQQAPPPQTQQQHTPATEGPHTGPKRLVSKTKLDGVTAHIVSTTHDHDQPHGHNQHSNADDDGQEHNDGDDNASNAAPRNTVITTICVALGGLVGCFCCILGSSRLAVCCYHRRLAAATAAGGGGNVGMKRRVICVDGKRIGRPRPLSSRSSSESLTGSHLSKPQQPQQRQQMTEFWNVDAGGVGGEGVEKSPTSLSTFKGGLLKTIRQSSFTSPFANTSKDTTKPPRPLPLAVTAPTAHVISSPVDFIPSQHSRPLDSSSPFSPVVNATSPAAGVSGLESYYSPYIGGWSNLDMPEHPSSSSAFSSAGSSATGTGATKSRRMPALSPLPLPRRNSQQQLLASSPLSSSSEGGGLVSPCTTTGSSCSEISPFPWSNSAPYLQEIINSNNKHNDIIDRTTFNSNTNSSRTATMMATNRAQKPSPIETTGALATSSSTLGTGPATRMMATPMTAATTMMYTSPSSNTRSPLLFSPVTSRSTEIAIAPSRALSLRPDRSGSGTRAESGTGTGSISRGPHDHRHHRHHHQFQQRQQQGYQYLQHQDNNNNSHSNSNSSHHSSINAAYQQQQSVFYSTH